MEKNSVMALTGPGAAALAVARICGPLTIPFLRQYFAREGQAGRCVHGELSDGQSAIDDIVVALAHDGQSADLNLHGSPWIVRRVIELAASFGFAVVSDSIPAALEAVDGDDLLQREMAAHLPSARSTMALRMLAAQPDAWSAIRQRETRLDKRWIEAVIADRSLWRLLNPPRVVIVGAPNVGKSTLANQLFGQERSITADLAGTTRDWVGEYTNVNGLPIMLVDTPGLREGSDAIEAKAIDGSRGQIAEADLLILLLDGSSAPEPIQSAIAAAHPAALRVVNKCDLPPAWNAYSIGGLKISAKSGVGIEELRNVIVAHFGCAHPDLRQPRWWTERQLDVLHRAVSDPKLLDPMWASPTAGW